MIKNIFYVEDGSVDLDELKSTLTTETKIIVYRQGSTPPVLIQPQLPINDIFSEAEFKAEKELKELRKETEELICKLLKEKCLTNRARKLINNFGIDLLERWLKAYPYGYCDGMNFQTCRANENTECPYCASNVHCSDGNAAVEYYRELLRFQRMKPRRARKIAIMFAETLPSIMRSLDAELAVRMREMREVEHE